MANYVCLREATDGPIGFAGVVSDNGAAGIEDGTYSFALVAWDDPDEKDLTRARFVTTTPRNPVPAAAGIDLWHLSRAQNLVVNTTPDNQGKITFAWQAPRHKPHHYALYYQASATYSFTTFGVKVIPATGTVNGDIPWYATSAVITNVTGYSASYYMRIIQEDLANRFLYVRGNYSAVLSSSAGAAVWEHPSGTVRTVDGVGLTWPSTDASTAVPATAEIMRLHLTTVPTASQTFLKVNSGYFGAEMGSGFGASEVLLQPATGIEHNARESVMPDLNGLNIPVNYINTAMDSEIQLIVPYTGMIWDTSLGSYTAENTGGAIAQLTKWREQKRLLVLIVNADTNIDIGPGQWTCTIKDCNDYQLPGVSNFDAVQITLAVEGYIPASYDYGYRAVTAVTAGSAVVVVGGTFDPRMAAGARVWIYASTGNDGLYVILSVSKAANAMSLTLDRVMADSTDDGMMILGAGV